MTHGLDADAAKLLAIGQDPGPTLADVLPPCGTTCACERADCPAPKFELCFGLAGGGYGPYEYCPVCEQIVSKSEEVE